jgi:hypothetical protein
MFLHCFLQIVAPVIFLPKCRQAGVDGAMLQAHIRSARRDAVRFLPKLGREISHGLFFAQDDKRKTTICNTAI